MAAPDFSHKWETLRPAERRLSGIRLAELPDPGGGGAGDCACAARSARNARQDRRAGHARPPARGARVGACSRAGASRPTTAPGKPLVRDSCRNACCWASPALRRRNWRRCRCSRLLKHPLVGGEGDERLAWLDAVRAARPQAARPAAGGGPCRARRDSSASVREWQRRRGRAWKRLDGLLREPIPLARFARRSRARRRRSPATAAWRGPDGRMAAELLAELQASEAAQRLTVAAEDAVPLLRQLLDCARGAAALWRASAHLHLGPARGAAPARRPGGARRTQRRRLAGAAGA